MNNEMNISTMLADQLSRLLTKEVSREVLMAVEKGEPATALWDQIQALGLPLALVPEASGGADMSWAETGALLRTLGEFVAPVPLGETIVGAWVLSNAGLSIPDGPLAVVNERMTLDAAGLISGSAPSVAWAQHATHLVVSANRGDENVVCLIERSQIDLEPQETLSRIPSARLNLKNIRPLETSSAASAISELGFMPYLAALRAGQISGALDRILALCVEYANTRTQFGKPIGKFQAIQQMIAELGSLAASAQAAALFACRRIDSANAEYGAAVAKAHVGRAAGLGSAIAHQVFGAIGVTDEHDLHYYTRRLWQWRTESGSEHFWSERLGHQVLANGNAGLWPSITE
ncbi:acyl-CoA dehydrogenase family protein [Pseudomonas sp. BF-R-19]|uniref:acyl-CoA dehydrogenase family protein n=1 Tax=Pseudomonas sp. BF-R-19 TaxID=2832397 RepID=UPI001CC0D719|nr:acyl-CoA dehydrogenase family protein [Pseudomonas sp. BF-R-19]